jgi:group II intron reverse transcriptase/maturase
MGEKDIPLTRIYRCLYNENLWLQAYGKISRNKGALTPGTDQDTADGMNLKKIRRIIDQLRHERYRTKPVRRIQIPKRKGGQRPLGISNFTDKLLQEVIRLLLEAYYEPRFRDSSHGFRPARGCHTALQAINYNFVGTVWFIEGDLKDCFSSLDHDILMNILAKDIHDNRFLNLIGQILKAGYLEQWRYQHTYSGVPQGSGLSPLLSNLYLNELDSYVEDQLIPHYTKGKKRAYHPEYRHLTHRLDQARKKGDRKLSRQLEHQRRQIPAQHPNDPNYRRLKYCRYADDFLVGFIGSKTEAETIKQQLGTFLNEHLRLTMHPDKTLITHAKTGQAHFLGYAISTYHCQTKLAPRTQRKLKNRSLNGSIRLGLPHGLVDEPCKNYTQNGKPIHQPALCHYSEAHIIYTFQQRFRGLAEYYKFAVDRARLAKLKYVMEISLTKTLANKLRTRVKNIYRRFHGKKKVNDYLYQTLQVEVPTPKGTTTIYWGAVPLTYHKPEPYLSLNDHIYQFAGKYTDLIQRLQANQCELCGSSENCEVHHIHKLAELKQRWRGRKAKPEWVKTMIALRRKTLVVCQQCHRHIHTGKPTPNHASRVLESRMPLTGHVRFGGEESEKR